jgi:hypothetical protein
MLNDWKGKMLQKRKKKLGAIECESVNVEVQWNNIKKYVLDAMSDWIGKVDSRATKPWIREGQGNERTKEV